MEFQGQSNTKTSLADNAHIMPLKRKVNKCTCGDRCKCRKTSYDSQVKRDLKIEYK